VAAVFALLLVSGVSAIASQAQARSREAERASGLLRILIESFRLSDPDLADGANMTVREALNKAATQVRMELADQPALMAELQLVIGSIYRDLGLHGAAEPLVEEAMRTRFASFGMDHVAAAEAMHARGWLYYLASDFGSAEELLRRALTVQRAALGESDTVVARTQDNLAEVLRATGRLDDALVLAQQVLDKRRRLLGRHADVAQSLNNVGVMQRQMGAVDDAEASFREALLIYDSLERTTDRDVLSSRSNLGMVLRARGQREEAAGLFSSVAEVQERRYGRTHPATITTVNNLGSVLAELGRVTEADSVLRDVLERWRERGEPDHLNAMTTRGNLADLMNRSQRYEEAESLQREVLTAFRSEFGENSVNTAIAANNLASTLVSRGRPTEAVSLYNGALAILDGRLAPEHSTVAIVRAGLGHALQQLDRCEEAEPLLRHAYSTLTANPGTRARAGTAGIDLGSCLMGLGRTDEAEQPLLEALDLVSSAPTERSRVLEAIVDLYEARGDTAEARRYHLMLNRVP
jgi:tetratricopeptide (TPR) repeat protein